MSQLPITLLAYSRSKRSANCPRLRNPTTTDHMKAETMSPTTIASPTSPPKPTANSHSRTRGNTPTVSPSTAASHAACGLEPSLPPVYPEALLTRIKETFYPEHHAWLLRHLTTREYVRADGIAQKPEDIHGPKIDRVGFGHDVLMHICWSSSGVNGRITNRGGGAGHRFDIVPVERHEPSIKPGEEWTDISARVAADIADSWGGDGRCR
ncbi:hypothetical protein MMC11_003570 [Xylographa trunciseda]|nr:hypothetical protein [Xylographa trunciseda]